MGVLPGGQRKGAGEGMGGSGVGKTKGKGTLIGQLIGEQCNSLLIQSTFHASLRQSKLFASFFESLF